MRHVTTVQKTGIVISIMLLASLAVIPHHLSSADSTNSTDSKATTSAKQTKQTASERIREFNAIQAEKATIAEPKQKALQNADAMKRKEVLDKKLVTTNCIVDGTNVHSAASSSLGIISANANFGTITTINTQKANLELYNSNAERNSCVLIY